MAINNFSTDLFVVNVNGRTIDSWGESDPPYTDSEIDPHSVLRRGLGGSAVRLDRINPGRSVTLNLQPGSPDSEFMSTLMGSKANITLGVRQVGTLEAWLGTEGIIVSRGEHGRGGQTITDDSWTCEFNIFEGTSGGT